MNLHHVRVIVQVAAACALTREALCASHEALCLLAPRSQMCLDPDAHKVVGGVHRTLW